ncbi:ExbD/TolR family protein [uncultured Maritimibacter sp.]|jgi:biopolymer transport protein TolR|uniref:ExbD/TolR family protein n=1 Tax=uncultured Maritimibacter sp. TaxID=991866 RepID=UPI000B092463|nr:ExbD/TolR family protein [uncultured Maritimibacter sp.]
MGGSVAQSGGGKPRARRGRRRGRNRAMMAEINITPFVDVMLVLLIIFMVAAPLMTVGIDIQMPETAANPLPTIEEEPLTLSITEDGRVAIMTTEVPRDELISRLQGIMTERADDKIFLRADGRIPYEDVAQIMGALNAAGMNNIGLVTETGGPALDGTPR